MLNKKFIEKMKKILIVEKNNLVKKRYAFDVDFDGDEADEIQGNLIIALNDQLSTRDVQKIRKIDNALKKIENKEYGVCEECEENILEKRLEVNPCFILCVDCAENQELEEKRNRF
jgi:DnaK suppressor protein